MITQRRRRSRRTVRLAISHPRPVSGISGLPAVSMRRPRPQMILLLFMSVCHGLNTLRKRTLLIVAGLHSLVAKRQCSRAPSIPSSQPQPLASPIRSALPIEALLVTDRVPPILPVSRPHTLAQVLFYQSDLLDHRRFGCGTPARALGCGPVD